MMAVHSWRVVIVISFNRGRTCAGVNVPPQRHHNESRMAAGAPNVTLT